MSHRLPTGAGGSGGTPRQRRSRTGSARRPEPRSAQRTDHACFRASAANAAAGGRCARVHCLRRGTRGGGLASPRLVPQSGGARTVPDAAGAGPGAHRGTGGAECGRYACWRRARSARRNCAPRRWRRPCDTCTTWQRTMLAGKPRLGHGTDVQTAWSSCGRCSTRSSPSARPTESQLIAEDGSDGERSLPDIAGRCARDPAAAVSHRQPSPGVQRHGRLRPRGRDDAFLDCMI